MHSMCEKNEIPAQKSFKHHDIVIVFVHADVRSYYLEAEQIANSRWIFFMYVQFT